MFGKYDKFTLTLVNAKDVNGKVLPFSLRLPISEEYCLPEELASIDVFEYHNGLVVGGGAYSIYIGEKTTMNELIKMNDISNVKVLENVKVISFDSPICFQDISGKKVVFAVLNEQDIVIDNKENLMEAIEKFSDKFNEIKNSINKVRSLYRKYK